MHPCPGLRARRLAGHAPHTWGRWKALATVAHGHELALGGCPRLRPHSSTALPLASPPLQLRAGHTWGSRGQEAGRWCVQPHLGIASLVLSWLC